MQALGYMVTMIIAVWAGMDVFAKGGVGYTHNSTRSSCCTAVAVVTAWTQSATQPCMHLRRTYARPLPDRLCFLYLLLFASVTPAAVLMLLPMCYLFSACAAGVAMAQDPFQ
jgi:hypothetical protein